MSIPTSAESWPAHPLRALTTRKAYLPGAVIHALGPALLVFDDAQYAAALASRAEVEKTKPFKEPIVTAIERAGAFYAAEEYH